MQTAEHEQGSKEKLDYDLQHTQKCLPKADNAQNSETLKYNHCAMEKAVFEGLRSATKLGRQQMTAVTGRQECDIGQCMEEVH